MKDSYFKYHRELVIHSFLLNGKGSIHDLLVESNARIREIDPDKEIGLRALEKHLKELREKHKFPIISYRPTNEELREKNYSSNVIQYPHKEIDIRKVKFLKYSKDFNPKGFLRDDEKNKIEEAFIILRRFIGQPGMEWLDEFIYNEDQLLNLTPFLEKKIQFEENLARVKKPFSLIKDALINEDVIKVKRDIRQSKLGYHDLIFHTHFLKIWNNKWYAFGYALEQNDNREFKNSPYVLPIDENIKDIKIINDITFQKSQFNYTGEPLKTFFFKDIIGVTNVLNKNPIDIVLRFHNQDKFDRLNIKPPHESWNVINENGIYTDVKMKVKINSELRNLIYKNSPGVEVIAPNSFRNIIKNEINKALSYYTNI